MKEPLPSPLVPAEVDLRDFYEFPLQFERLFASDTWIVCSPEEKIAALRLWCKSWHQEPAGSLPMNDRLLANLAGYGEAVSAWLKVKEHAMIGWTACSDGRFYHPVVGEIAVDKWAKKKRRRVDNERDRERKRRKRGVVHADTSSDKHGCPADTPPLSGGHAHNSHDLSAGIPPENALKGKGREGKGSKKDPEPNGSDGMPSLEAEVYRQGKRILGKNAGGQITQLRKVAGSDVQALALLEEAERKENRAEWIAGVIRNRGDTRETDELGLPKTAIGDLGKSTDELYGRLGIA